MQFLISTEHNIFLHDSFFYVITASRNNSLFIEILNVKVHNTSNICTSLALRRVEIMVVVWTFGRKIMFETKMVLRTISAIEGLRSSDT